jgi:hypothetical protein
MRGDLRGFNPAIWTRHKFIPPQVLVLATFQSKAAWFSIPMLCADSATYRSRKSIKPRHWFKKNAYRRRSLSAGFHDLRQISLAFIVLKKVNRVSSSLFASKSN